jgi:hypothetical protein
VVVVRWLILIDLKWLELLDLRILQMGFCIYSLSNNNLREVGLSELYITKKKKKKKEKKKRSLLKGRDLFVNFNNIATFVVYNNNKNNLYFKLLMNLFLF